MNMKNERIPSRTLDCGPFYHGTKAELKAGDMLEPGYSSNYGERKKANYVYLTATLDPHIFPPIVASEYSDEKIPWFQGKSVLCAR